MFHCGKPSKPSHSEKNIKSFQLLTMACLPSFHYFSNIYYSLPLCSSSTSYKLLAFRHSPASGTITFYSMYLESSFGYIQTFLLFLFEIFGQMSTCNFFLIILFTSLTFYFPVAHSIYKLNFLSFLHRSYAAAVAELPQSSRTLPVPMDCCLPGSSVHGILQTRKLECVVMPSSRWSSRPRDRTHISYLSCIGRWDLYHYYHLGSPQNLYLLLIT